MIFKHPPPASIQIQEPSFMWLVKFTCQCRKELYPLFQFKCLSLTEHGVKKQKETFVSCGIKLKMRITPLNLLVFELLRRVLELKKYFLIWGQTKGK